MGDSAKYLAEVLQRLRSINQGGVVILTQQDQNEPNGPFIARFQVEVASLWKPLVSPEDRVLVVEKEEGREESLLLQEHWSTREAFASKALAKQVLSQGILASFPKPFPFLGFKRLVKYLETRFPTNSFCLHLRHFSLDMKEKKIIIDPDVRSQNFAETGYIAPSLLLAHTVGLFRSFVTAISETNDLQAKALLFQFIIKLWLKKEWHVISPMLASECAKIETMTTETRNQVLYFAWRLQNFTSNATYSHTMIPANGRDAAVKRRCVEPSTTTSSTQGSPSILKFRVPTLVSRFRSQPISWPYGHPVSTVASTQITITPVSFDPLTSGPSQVTVLKNEIKEEKYNMHDGVLPAPSVGAFEVEIVSYNTNSSSKEMSAYLHQLGLIVLLNLLFSNQAYKHISCGSLDQQVTSQHRKLILRTREENALPDTPLASRIAASRAASRRPSLVQKRPPNSSYVEDHIPPYSMSNTSRVLNSTDAYLDGIGKRLAAAPVARSFLNDVIQLLKVTGLDSSCLVKTKSPHSATWTLSNILWPLAPCNVPPRHPSSLHRIEVPQILASENGIDLLTKAMLGLETILLGTSTLDKVHLTLTSPPEFCHIELRQKEAEEACAVGLIGTLHLLAVARLTMGSGLLVLFRENPDPRDKMKYFLKCMSKQAPGNDYQIPTELEDRMTAVLNASTFCTHPLRANLAKPAMKLNWYLFTEVYLLTLFPWLYAPKASPDATLRLRAHLKLPPTTPRSRDACFSLLIERLGMLGIDLHDPAWPSVESLLSEYLRLVVNDDVWRPLQIVLEPVLSTSLPQLRLKYASEYERWTVKANSTPRLHKPPSFEILSTSSRSEQDQPPRRRVFNVSRSDMECDTGPDEGECDASDMSDIDMSSANDIIPSTSQIALTPNMIDRNSSPPYRSIIQQSGMHQAQPRPSNTTTMNQEQAREGPLAITRIVETASLALSTPAKQSELPMFDKHLRSRNDEAPVVAAEPVAGMRDASVFGRHSPTDQMHISSGSIKHANATLPSNGTSLWNLNSHETAVRPPLQAQCMLRDTQKHLQVQAVTISPDYEMLECIDTDSP